MPARLRPATLVACGALAALVACGGSDNPKKAKGEGGKRRKADATEVAASPEPPGEPDEARSGGRRGKKPPPPKGDLADLADPADAGPLADPAGTLSWDRAGAPDGARLVVSGHAPELVEIGLDGAARRTWTLPADRRRDGDPPGFRRAAPLPDGGLVALIEGRALVRFAPDGSVAWRLDGSFHRDLDVGRDGAIVSLTFEPQHLNNMSREHPTKAEQLAWVTPEGAVQKKLSLLSALVRSPHWHLVEALDVPDGDILHTSSVDLLDDPGPDPAFAAGRVVVTVPVIDAVLVFDPAEEVFPWGIVGDPLHAPQAARLTPGGLLVLDNQSGPSTVRLFDPKTKAELRTFAGSPAVPFATPSAGAVHLLPNRDLLVVSTHEGRATELSPQGQVVWTWQTPYAAAAGRAAPLFDVLPR